MSESSKVFSLRRWEAGKPARKGLQMNLLLPVNAPDHITRMLQYGENMEFYAGFSLQSWQEAFGPYEDLNRMSSFRSQANMDGFEKIAQLVAAARGHEVFITLNSGIYSTAQMDFLKDVLVQLGKMQVSGVILGDAQLAPLVRSAGLKAVASTMIGIYNEDIAKYCLDQGFQRLIFPRDLTLEEIQQIVTAVPGVEYECFLMRNGCRYSDSNCLARHSDRYGALCTFLDRSRPRYCGAPETSFSAHDEAVFNHLMFTHVFHKSACGICALWDLMQMGIHAGKVVGRADGADSIEEDVILLNRNMEIAACCGSRAEYLSRLQLPRRYDSMCYQGCSCYYPEIRYGGPTYEAP